MTQEQFIYLLKELAKSGVDGYIERNCPNATTQEKEVLKESLKVHLEQAYKNNQR